MGQNLWDEEELECKKLTSAEVVDRLKNQPRVSPWGVIGAQIVVGFFVACLTVLITGRESAGWSAGYGSLTVVCPAVLFLRGLTGRFASLNAATAGLSFFVWEAIKIAVTCGMLFVATQVVADLDWVALLAGLFVTLKVYLVAPWLCRIKITV